MKHVNELLLVGSLCCFGCAMSPSAYDELASEVSARNAARHEAAMERFQTEGYEWAVDVALLALLDEDGTEQCRSALSTSPAPDPETTARVRIVAPNPAGGPSTPRAELDVPIGEACEFFVGRGDRLSGVDADGAPTELLRSTHPIARDSAGELVWVEVVRDVISERTVLVEQTCNEMPTTSDPFERPPAPVSVIPPPEPSRRVRVAVEHEELDHECTDVVE